MLFLLDQNVCKFPGKIETGELAKTEFDALVNHLFLDRTGLQTRN